MKHQIVAPTDTSGIAALLRCTERWASELTAEAREAADEARDAEIVAAMDRGETQASTEARLKVSHGTVVGIQRAAVERRDADRLKAQTGTSAEHSQKRNSSISDNEPPAQPSAPDAIAASTAQAQQQAALAEMESPRANRWHGALRALRHINAQASIEEMFAERYRRIDHVLQPELERARLALWAAWRAGRG